MMNAHSTAALLDPREQHYRIPGQQGLSLFLRYMAPAPEAKRDAGVVLYVHGGTFPSALSIAHRLDGQSWRDALCAAGFHVWGLDFHGFGRLSDPYPEMLSPAKDAPPLGRVGEACSQLEQAVRFIRAHHGGPRVSIVAHSWGTMVTGLFAGRHPELMDRLVFFGPIAPRPPSGKAVQLPAWRLISLQDQWDRFTGPVPKGTANVLSHRHFDTWGEAYLNCDPESRNRSPAAVLVPSGAFQDIYDAWTGVLPYDPALIRAPVAIVRGEWDDMCNDGDAGWLFNALTAASVRRDVKIGRATHLMHLESARFALYRETEAFLTGGDIAELDT